MLTVLAVFLLLPALTHAVCDGNPHNWGRLRRCDQPDPGCPDVYTNCTVCEGIGGVAFGDLPDEFHPTTCRPVATAAEMYANSTYEPAKPSFPTKFVNTGFYEVQIFVKHDPLCLAQIPAMVSNGTHCYKPQEGTFNYNEQDTALRIDYLKATTPFKNINMTEHFHHIDDCVHPEITQYGIDRIPICPCINISTGPVRADWASDAILVGRELLGIEYLSANTTLMVDHWVKGPHHAWVDIESKQIVRLWQPYNGLEVFDPTQWSLEVKEDLRKQSKSCELGSHFCINAYSSESNLVPAISTLLASRVVSHD